MKKILVLFLILALSFAALVGCEQIKGLFGGNTECTEHVDANADGKCDNCSTEMPPEGDENLDAAVAYVLASYEQLAGEVKANFDLMKQATIGSSTYRVEWTSNNGDVVISDSPTNQNVVTVYVANVTRGTEDIHFTITAKVFSVDGSTSRSFSLNYFIPKLGALVPSDITSADQLNEETPYKFYLFQEAKGENYYLKGGMSGYYMATSTSVEEAIDVYVEIVDGGYKLYVFDDDAKSYIAVEKSSDGAHTNVLYNASGSVFTFNAEHKTFVTNLTEDGKEVAYFLGTYGNNVTFGASNFEKHIATSYPGHFAQMVDASTITDESKVATEKENLVFDNSEVVIDKVINLALKGGTYEDVKITWTSDNAAAVVTDEGTLAVTVGNTAFNVKVTATITCGSASDTVEFTLPVAAKSSTTVTIVDAPVANTVYYGYLLQGKLAKEYYVTAGEISKGALPTSDDCKNAIAIYAEVSGEGYKFYILGENDAKQYLEVYQNDTYVNLQYSNNGSVFTLDEKYSCWVTTFNNKTYYIGAYNDRTVIGVSEYSYIKDDNIGSTQFILQLVTINCEHEYSADCDTTCNLCPATREVTAEHVDADNNNICDNCGFILGEVILPAEEKTILEAIEIGSAQSHDTYTAEKYIITAVIKSVYNTQYGNMILVDEAGNEFTLYGSYNADGTVSYKDLEYKPVTGDTVTVLGVLGQYSNKPQMKNGWITAVVAHEHTYNEYPETCDICKAVNATHTECTYDDACDAVCGACGAERVAPHVYAYPCATVCSACNAEVVPGACVDTDKNGVCDNCSNTMPSNTTVTVDLTARGYANAEEVTEVVSGDVTLTFDKGTNSNTPKWYNSGAAVRIYGGGTLTISAGEGKVITSVIITFGTSDGSNEITVNAGELNDGEWSGRTEELVLTVGGTSGNRRFAAIEVIYE